MKKDSVLEEDAYIYRHKAGKSEREVWDKLSRGEKWQYFKDYYRNKVIFAVLLVAFLASLLVSVLSPRPVKVLSIAVINDYLNPEGVEDLKRNLTYDLGLDEGRQEILIDATYMMGEDSLDPALELVNVQKFVAKLAAGDINVIIADRKKFEELVKDNTFLKISELGKEGLEPVGGGYGILLKENEILKQAGSMRDELMLGVVANAREEDFVYIRKFITHLLRKF